ncbi:MAG: hypothetical protein QM811_15730 [Pirellulales bacterium]
MVSVPSPRRIFQLTALACGVFLAGCQKGEAPVETPVFVAEKLPIDATLRDRIDGVIDHTLNHRRLNTRDHAAWQVVHALLAFGDDLQIEHEGQLVPAQRWLLEGNRLTGWNLRVGDRGILVPVEESSKTGQGHPDQWIGYLTQNGLAPDTPIKVEGKQTKPDGSPYVVRDLLTQVQWDVVPGMEATWLLMAVGHPAYWELDIPWTSRSGERWTVERLAEMEGKAQVVGGSCGGTHRLYALAMAVNHKLAAGELEPSQLTGGWKTANDRVEEFKKLTRERFQNADGTFSGHYYVRPGAVTEYLGSRRHDGAHLRVPGRRVDRQRAARTVDGRRMREIGLDDGTIQRRLARLRRHVSRRARSDAVPRTTVRRTDRKVSGRRFVRTGKLTQVLSRARPARFRPVPARVFPLAAAISAAGAWERFRGYAPPRRRSAILAFGSIRSESACGTSTPCPGLRSKVGTRSNVRDRT